MAGEIYYSRSRTLDFTNLEARGLTRYHKTVQVDFIKVGRKVQIIEKALLKLDARRKGRSTPLKSFSKVGRRAQNSL